MFPMVTLPNLPQKKAAFCFGISSVLFHILLVHSADERYEACQPTNCGTNPPITIRYPFHFMDEKTKFCGYPGFHVTCKENKTIYNTSCGEYIIKNISYENQSFRLVNSGVLESKCIPHLNYFALDRSPFLFDQNFVDLKLLYSCNKSFPQTNYTKHPITCASNQSHQSYAVLDPEKKIKCEEMPCHYCVAAPVELERANRNKSSDNNMDYMELLENGFILKWNGISCSKCERSGGRCGFDANNGTVCFCRDRPHREHCHDGKSLNPLTNAIFPLAP